MLPYKNLPLKTLNSNVMMSLAVEISHSLYTTSSIFPLLNIFLQLSQQGVVSVGRETNGRLGVGPAFEPTANPITLNFFSVFHLDFFFVLISF